MKLGVPSFGFFLLSLMLAFVWLGALPVEASEIKVSTTSKANVAFYYRDDLPVDLLQAYDQVVIDPARAKKPSAKYSIHTEWVARVSTSERDNQPAVDWLKSRIEPLWSQGYRAFYLDDGVTLDKPSPSDAVMAERLTLLKAQHPDSAILLHNHAELLATHAHDLSAWVTDSVFQRYDRSAGVFLTVNDASRVNVLARLNQLHHQYPALNRVDVEFCETYDLACRRRVAQTSAAAGLTPFVTDPKMTTVGIGRIEVMPRRVLVVQSMDKGAPIESGTGSRVLSMPFDYLGYDVQYVNVNDALPNNINPDRYAGIATYLDQDVTDSESWRQWFMTAVNRGVHVAVFEQFGFDIDPEMAQSLGLRMLGSLYPLGSTAKIDKLDPIMGFERHPMLDVQDAVGVELLPKRENRSLARVKVNGIPSDMAAITGWGGYVLAPFSVDYLEELDQMFWVVNPIKFLKQALALPDMPVPDTTTENGRRLMFVQIDGDGFASRAEFSGPDYGAEALYDQVFKAYPIPTTVSVVEGEVGPQGKYPQLSPKLESIARKIFALPNVEIGSHGYAHPLDWILADQKYHEEEEHISLHFPGYHFNIDREIRGSIDYINQRLAPPGKKVKIMQWTGEANPTPEALQKASQVGVYNINGGDTLPTKTDSSWTEISGAGIAKGEGDENFQIYAAEMNENIYTHDWTRPFYGMVRVMETFEITEHPLRLKPIDLYYHFYSGTKLASLKALINVYDVTLRQPIFPIYTTEYVERVLEARHAVVAREGDHWLIRTGPALREFRLPSGEAPDLAQAQGVSGYLPTAGAAYVHLSGDQASFAVTQSTQKSGQPFVAAAAAFIDQVQHMGHELRLTAWGYYQPYVVFEQADHCSFRLDGQSVQRTLDKKRRSVIRFSGDVTGNTRHTIEVQCE